MYKNVPEQHIRIHTHIYITKKYEKGKAGTVEGCVSAMPVGQIIDEYQPHVIRAR